MRIIHYSSQITNGGNNLPGTNLWKGPTLPEPHRDVAPGFFMPAPQALGWVVYHITIQAPVTFCAALASLQKCNLSCCPASPKLIVPGQSSAGCNCFAEPPPPPETWEPSKPFQGHNCGLIPVLCLLIVICLLLFILLCPWCSRWQTTHKSLQWSTASREEVYKCMCVCWRIRSVGGSFAYPLPSDTQHSVLRDQLDPQLLGTTETKPSGKGSPKNHCRCQAHQLSPAHCCHVWFVSLKDPKFTCAVNRPEYEN